MSKKLTSNMGLKILSLFIAALLWFNAVTEKTYTVTRKIPLIFKNPPAGLQIVSNPPDSILLTMSASGKTLIQLSFFKPVAIVDLSKAREGANRIVISKKNIRFPTDLSAKIVDIQPTFLNITLARKVRKKVKIVPLITGVPGKNLAVSKIKIEYPKNGRATLVGPRLWISKVTHIFTDSISINKLKKDSVFTVKLIPPHKGVKVIPESAKVHILLENRKSAWIKIPISFKNVKKSYHLEASSYYLKLQVSGAPSVLKDTVNINVSINLNKFPPGDYLLKPQIQKPDLIKIDSIEPAEILVKIRKIGVKYPF